MKNDSKQTKSGKRIWGLFGWSLVILMFLGGFWLYSVFSEVGPGGFLAMFAPSQNNHQKFSVRLIDQPIYKVKKKQDVFGVSVLRIISKQQPEEFLVLEGVSRPLVDRVYGKPPDLAWANLMANQLIKLRQSGDGGSPISVDVQTVKTLKSGVITQKRQKVPYWQLEVQFKLSNESAPRAYEVAIIRNLPPGQSEKSAKDTLLVGYAQKEAFQKELVADLMSNLRFEQN